MTQSSLSGQKWAFKVVVVMLICTILLQLIQTDICKTTKEIKEVITTHLDYVFHRNDFQKTSIRMKEFGLGSGRVIATEHLNDIPFDNDCSRHRFLVFTCDFASLCGGWGDREKGLVSSFLLSLLTNRTFVLNITQPCDLKQFLQPNVYNWNRCNNFLRTVSKQDITKFNYVVGNRKFLKQIQHFDFDANWTTQVIVLRFNAYVINGIRMHKLAETRLNWLLKTTNEEAIHLVLHTLFKPTQRFLQDALKFHMSHVRGKHLVGCHIRKGKNPSIPKDNILHRGTPNESLIFDFLNGYDDDNRNVIYIATDSDDVKKQAETELDTYVNINRTIVHIDRLGKLNHYRTEACEGFYTVLLEQYILSQSDTLILTRSNYGGIAAYIRGSSDNLFLYNQKTHEILKSNLTNMQNVFLFI